MVRWVFRRENVESARDTLIQKGEIPPLGNILSLTDSPTQSSQKYFTCFCRFLIESSAAAGVSLPINIH